MIEGVSDSIQLLVLAVCFALAFVRTIRVRNIAWVTLTCFYSCMLLANAYWLVYLLVFGESVAYSYISDMGWMAGYVFLLMLAVEVDQRRGPAAPVPLAWVPVVVCMVCCIYYIVTSGHALLNLIDNGLLAAVGFFAVRGIAASPPEQLEGNHLADNKSFHGAMLVFVFVEQAVWLSSSFLEPGSMAVVNPYIVAGFVLTISYAVILACAWRSDAP